MKKIGISPIKGYKRENLKIYEKYNILLWMWSIFRNYFRYIFSQSICRKKLETSSLKVSKL